MSFLVCVLALRSHARAGDPPSASPPPPPGVAAPFWTATELALIDRGLEAANCDRKDLQFQKRPIDDPFRLEVVNRVLDDPLSIGAEAQAWDDAATTGNPSRILGRARAALGVPTPTPGAEAPEPEEEHQAFPPGLALAMASFLPSLTAAARSGEALRAPFGADAEAVLRKALGSQVEKPAIELPGAELTDERFLALVGKADRTALLDRARSLVARVEELVRALKALDPQLLGVSKAGVHIETGAGAVVVSGLGDDVHDEGDDVICVIDLGGNDTWLRGASAVGRRAACVCIDLAGDDRYVGRKDLSFGAALGGVAIQWDVAGNDLYDAGNASLGAGILGVGVLVDAGGDDVYRCKDFGDGAGAFGVGIAIDGGGNDLHHADLFGQGFASTWGCGVLAELGGHDVYDAGGVHSDAPLHRDRTQSLSQGFSIGMRPDASGGVGVLVDVAGNDRYAADIYGQGASYWFSLGLLIDDDGNDTYVLGHYGQGAGIHLSAGMLLERAGQDLYYDEYGVGIGGAHDYAVGFLVDRGGDDHYAGSGGSQGGSLSNSVAMLLDDAGDDGYTAVRGGSQGYGGPARDTGGIGLFLDGGGKDVYSEHVREDGVWASEQLGVGLDEPTPPDAPTADPMGAGITPEAAKAHVDEQGSVRGSDGKPVDDLDKLWEIGKRWQVGDERVIGPIARARLVALGAKALDRAVERLASKDGLELECCEAIFRGFPAPEVAARLLAATKAEDVAVRRSAVRFLGALGFGDATPRLVELLADAQVRGYALRALGVLKQAPKEVLPFLRSPKEAEGVAVTVCLAAAGDAASLDALVSALSPETAFPVRLAAEQRLAALGEAAVPALGKAAATAPTLRARRSALRALGGTKSPAAVAAVRAALGDADPWVRFSARQAADALAKALPSDAARDLRASVDARRAAETDPFVKRLR